MQNIGYPSKSPDLDVLPGFVNPPAGYGEVPFYWWVGDKLTRERLLWQLEKLAAGGICGLQVNYAHTDKGGNVYGITMPSDPPLFSDEWWDIFTWWAGECSKRGISVSLSDYTLGIVGQGFWMDDILADDPEMRGSVLEFIQNRVNEGQVSIQYPENPLSVVAYKLNGDDILPGTNIDLRSYVNNSTLNWKAPQGEWVIVAVYRRIVDTSVDPINPKLGDMVIKKFFTPFENALPGETGKGLNFFFSDELTFGVAGNLWTRGFEEEFSRRKGYDILPMLPALFVDIGSVTPKIRMDYCDVIVTLCEESYFKPVFEWHTQRGMIYGCDHGGRGTDVVEFGDYFRTQRWMSGPGCDSPELSAHVIKNKVAASIAHLYERPRVWLEGYHSSGWGMNTEELVRCTSENFVMGHNLLSLHGLYYTTHGGWWEWAPPCNHFRMPYWQHMGEFLKFSERLSYLMSQGVHRCDVAIVYPVASMDAGMDGRKSVDAAFDIADKLFNMGIDFDFIDFESLERAEFADGEIRVSGEAYRALILPSMRAVRHSTIEAARDFAKAGGLVIAAGALPEASERVGRDDLELRAIISEIFDANAIHIKNDLADGVARAIQEAITPRDFAPSQPCRVNHRKIGPRDVYMITSAPQGTECFFRAKGKAELWDPWTGNTRPLPIISESNDGTTLRLPFDADQMQIIVFTRRENYQNALDVPISETRTEVNGDWEFEIIPTLDNTWGDFRLPVTDKIIGAEARRFAYRQDDENLSNPDLDDSDWRRVTHGFGQRFWKLGPIPDGADEGLLASLMSIDPSKPVTIDGGNYFWQPYEYGLRQGIEGDPGHQGWHGLKENVTNDFIALGKKIDHHHGAIYERECDGVGHYYLWTTVPSDQPINAKIHKGGMLPSAAWINGKMLAESAKTAHIGEGANTILLRYEDAGRGHFILQAGDAVEAPEYPLAMKWYTLPGVLEYDPTPEKSSLVGWYRFTAPPGLRSMKLTAKGSVRAWANGIEMESNGEEFISSQPNLRPCIVAIKIEQNRGFYGGSAIPEPIALQCEGGEISLGDWSKIASLESYSGGVKYSKTIDLSQDQISGNLALDLGEVIASAEVWVNGQKAGVRMSTPYRVDISDYVCVGNNRVEVIVYNTLANHYSTIPTRYKGSLKSGLIGPVTIVQS